MNMGCSSQRAYPPKELNNSGKGNFTIPLELRSVNKHTRSVIATVQAALRIAYSAVDKHFQGTTNACPLPLLVWIGRCEGNLSWLLKIIRKAIRSTHARSRRLDTDFLRRFSSLFLFFLSRALIHLAAHLRSRSRGLPRRVHRSRSPPIGNNGSPLLARFDRIRSEYLPTYLRRNLGIMCETTMRSRRGWTT